MRILVTEEQVEVLKNQNKKKLLKWSKFDDSFLFDLATNKDKSSEEQIKSPNDLVKKKDINLDSVETTGLALYKHITRFRKELWKEILKWYYQNYRKYNYIDWSSFNYSTDELIDLATNRNEPKEKHIRSSEELKNYDLNLYQYIIRNRKDDWIKISEWYEKNYPISGSVGESILVKILEKHNFKFVKEKIFEDCRGKISCRLLRFDFFIENKNVCIEYDGKQHFNVSFKGQEDFSIVCNDKQKNDFIENNKNYSLIRISYKTKIAGIEEELINAINSINGGQIILLDSTYPEKGWNDPDFDEKYGKMCYRKTENNKEIFESFLKRKINKYL